MTYSKIENLFEKWSHLDASEQVEFMDKLSLVDRKQLQDWIESRTHAKTESNTSFPENDDLVAAHFPTTVSPEKIGDRSLEKSTSGTPDRIGDYRVLNVIAVHGQGVVYRADHSRLNRQVVIKVVKDKLSDHACQSLIDEGRSLASLSHPNIAQIFDLTIHEGKPCLVMEYIDGRNLSELYTGTPLPSKEAASLVQSIAMGMEHAHRNGVIHRDLKPANVVLRATDKLPKIIDFGLAKARNAFSLQADNSSYGGTIAFMAPEQAEWVSRCSKSVQMDDPTDERTDVFALGAILYSLLTGRKLYEAENLAATLEKAVDCDFDPVELERFTDSKRLREVCLKALSPDPSERFRSASDFADALAGSQKTAGLWITTALLSSIFGVLVLFAFGLWQSDGARRAGANTTESKNESTYPTIEILHQYYPPSEDMGRNLPLFESRGVVEDDEARIAVDFHNPVYSFIFAINTDGVVQLCYPEQGESHVQASPIQEISFPSDPVKVFPFTDGPGQQTFLIVWSSHTLKSFSEWLPSLGGLSSIPKQTKGRWIWKEGGIESWGHRTRLDQTSRGDIRNSKRLSDFINFTTLCEKLRVWVVRFMA